MNTIEFRSWFDGFSEAIGKDEMPTLNQWKRIQEEVYKLTSDSKVDQPFHYRYDPGVRGPSTDPFEGNNWPKPVITCRTGITQNYGDTIDKLSKNGTSDPELGVLEEVFNRR